MIKLLHIPLHISNEVYVVVLGTLVPVSLGPYVLAVHRLFVYVEVMASIAQVMVGFFISQGSGVCSV